jgi:hypothetical protein
MWEVLGVVTSFRQNVERLKLYRASVSVIRFLSVLNLTYTLVGAAFLILAFCPQWTTDFTDQQRFQFMKLGVFVCIFAPLALTADVLALRGLRFWKRSLLLPWLVLYAVIILLVLSVVLSGIFHRGFHWQYLLLAICSFCFLSAWRHIRYQYSDMLRERPVSRTFEDLASDIRAVSGQTVASGASPASDLPPKYEDLEQPPPYDAGLKQNP